MVAAGEANGLRKALGERSLFHPREAVVWTMLAEHHAGAGRAGQAAACAVIAGRVEQAFPEQLPIARA